ncbi:MAG: FkbM family methyltransferase [Alphaproteobacteria bacterium]|nr:FkbM family methyltransferase [Alphaproteobacteria bacterium]
MSRRVAGWLAGLVVGATAAAPPWRRANLRLMVAERLQQRHRVQTRHGPLVFVSTHLRALESPREFFAREPETLAWIDGFASGAVFWDIGANLGIYSLYGARRGDLEVIAFEPAAASYAGLCANLAANRLDRVRAYCLALDETTRLGTLNVSATYPGSVYNAFEQQAELDGAPVPVGFRQAVLGVSADDMVDRFGAPPPHHIKLDVDSTEAAILRGAARVLRAPALRSVLVETTQQDSPQNGEIDALMSAAGFRAESRGRGGPLTVNVIYRRSDA